MPKNRVFISRDKKTPLKVSTTRKMKTYRATVHKNHFCRICKGCSMEFETALSQKIFCTRQCRDNYTNVLLSDPATKARRHLPKTTIGAMHEFMVASDLMLKGFHVFRALSPTTSCDLVILKEKKVMRVEVKTGTRKNGKPYFSKGNSEKYDILAVVLDSEILYFPKSKRKNAQKP